MCEYQVRFVWLNEPHEEDQLTVLAQDAEEAIKQIRDDYEPIKIISVMPFADYKKLQAYRPTIVDGPSPIDHIL
jgi:hypothetical protein